MTKTCPACGSEIPDSTKICPTCGFNTEVGGAPIGYKKQKFFESKTFQSFLIYSAVCGIVIYFLFMGLINEAIPHFMPFVTEWMSVKIATWTLIIGISALIGFLLSPIPLHQGVLYAVIIVVLIFGAKFGLKLLPDICAEDTKYGDICEFLKCFPQIIRGDMTCLNPSGNHNGNGGDTDLEKMFSEIEEDILVPEGGNYPRGLLYAIAKVETGAQHTKDGKVKEGGSGEIGIMQIYSIGMCNMNKEQVKDIENNIKCGAMILAEKYNIYKDGLSIEKISCDDTAVRIKYSRYTKWKAAVRGYNGWNCGSSGINNYVETVNSKCNGCLG